jgi:hypothetical protein
MNLEKVFMLAAVLVSEFACGTADTGSEGARSSSIVGDCLPNMEDLVRISQLSGNLIYTGPLEAALEVIDEFNRVAGRHQAKVGFQSGPEGISLGQLTIMEAEPKLRVRAFSTSLRSRGVSSGEMDFLLPGGNNVNLPADRGSNIFVFEYFDPKLGELLSRVTTQSGNDTLLSIEGIGKLMDLLCNKDKSYPGELSYRLSISNLSPVGVSLRVSRFVGPRPPIDADARDQIELHLNHSGFERYVEELKKLAPGWEYLKGIAGYPALFRSNKAGEILRGSCFVDTELLEVVVGSAFRIFSSYLEEHLEESKPEQLLSKLARRC